jgi:hypothetical protein
LATPHHRGIGWPIVETPSHQAAIGAFIGIVVLQRG